MSPPKIYTDYTQYEKMPLIKKIRVLIRKGSREGQKGWIEERHSDGTIRVSFILSIGGGSEHQFFLLEDLEELGEFTPCRVRGIGHDHLAQECSHYRDCPGCGFCISSRKKDYASI